ncbi:TRAP transporter substrate-binding protein [uncultured Vibrio sp.]|uniref:TRAP transporter substrate-binding protein n=1 Tax=uncultured Vibrio sp. TaxID=114054 RepID=UPI002AAB402E|nr:TRAP transporter substrate-binding protein [uncultured Vibrio sp.]
MPSKFKSCLIMGCSTLLSLNVYAAEFNLRMSHPWPATSAINQGLTEWAQSIENASEDRINVDIYPSQTLTKSAKSYEAVIHNIADITATVQGYTANRFPLSQIVELPGVVQTAAQGSCIIQKLYDEGDIKQEYSDTHVLFMYTNGPGHIHMKDGQVIQPQDLQGKRVRQPTAIVGQLLKNLGAQPTGIPAPNAYEALEKGVLEGVAISWDGAKVFRLGEIAPYHTELNLYSLSFVVTMNKNVYQRLPADLQSIIDKHSGNEWSQHMARVFDRLDQEAINEAKQRNDQVVALNEDIKEVWQPELKKVTTQYLDELESKGLPAKQVYQRIQDIQKECDS